MKKITILLLLSVVWLSSFGQVADVNRQTKTPLTGASAGNQSVRDYNLTAIKNLRIPVGSSFSIAGAKDSIGYIMFNTSIQRMGVYKGSGSWDTLSTSAGSLYLAGYGLLKTGNTFRVDTGGVNGIVSKDRLSSYTYSKSQSDTKFQTKVFINFADYGVTGDGVTDDYAAIQAALSAVPNGGGTVIPQGISGSDFKCSAPLNVKAFTHILGYNIRRPRFFVSHNGTAMVLNGEGIKLDGILIDAAGAFGIGGGSGNAIDIISSNTVNTSWIQLNSVEAISNGYALNIDGSARTIQPGDITISNCALFKNNTGVAMRVLNHRYVSLTSTSLFASGSSTASSLYVDPNSQLFRFYNGSIVGMVDLRGDSPQMFGANVGNSIDVYGDNASIIGGTTTGNVTIQPGADNNVFGMTRVGTASYTDNGSGNRVIAYAGGTTGTMPVFSGANSLSDSYIKQFGSSREYFIENPSTYAFWYGLDGNDGYVGSKNATSFKVKTNGVDRAITDPTGVTTYSYPIRATSNDGNPNTLVRNTDLGAYATTSSLSNFLTTNTSQTGLTGDKTFSAGVNHTFGSFGSDYANIATGEFQAGSASLNKLATLSASSLRMLNAAGAYHIEAGATTVGSYTATLPASSGTIALKEHIKYGQATIVTDGVQTVFTIPHGLGSNPTAISLTFADAANSNLVQSVRSKDATNITITCSTAPVAGSNTVWWQAYK